MTIRDIDTAGAREVPGGQAEDAGSLGSIRQEGRKVARAAGLMGLLTLLSRILGLARDVGQAAVLGTGMAADAFTLAFVIPNILRRLFGESTVSAALVPTFTSTLVSRGGRESSKLGSKVLTFSALCLSALSILGILAAPLLVALFAPGFGEVPGKALLSTQLLRFLFPYILFVGTAAVVMGMLNSARHFLTPSLGPVLFNLLALAGLFALPAVWRADAPVWPYSAGILAGGIAQLLVQLPALRRNGIFLRPDFGFRDSEFRSVLRLAVPALVGLVAAEFNVLVDQMVASLLEEGSVAALSYGNRIMQFPLGIFAVASATALLPTLSRQAAAGRLSEARKTLGYATLGLAALLVPATLFTSVLGRQSVAVLLSRGAFGADSVDLTASALTFYSIGLVFYGGVKITAPVFYAMRDTKTPAMIGMASMGLNIVLNVALSWLFITTGWARPLAGVALATSLSSAANLVALRIAMRKRLGPGIGAPARAWAAVPAASGACLWLLFAMRPLVDSLCEGGTLPGLAALTLAALASLACFLIVLVAAGGRGTVSLLKLVLGRGGEAVA